MKSVWKPVQLLSTISVLALCCWGVYLAANFVFGAGLAGKWEYQEVGRFKSPDSQVEAVIIEGSAGATTSTVTSVYLVPREEKVKDEDREKSVFDADHIKSFKLVWREPRLVEIHFQEARIHGFRNYWAGLTDFRDVVELRLCPAMTNYSLSERDSGRTPR